MNKNIKQKLFFSLLFICFPALTFSESFRVGKVHTVSVKQEAGFETSATLGINEALAIALPEDKIFIEGLEIKMDIPESVAYWMDSVACSVYDSIKPKPTPAQIDYSGTRAYVSTLPGKLSWVLQIPIIKDNSIKSNRYTTKVDTIIEPQNNILFLRLQPVMKGVPEETLKALIPISVKPILKDKGLLKLKLNCGTDELQACTVFIDDKPADYPVKSILLETGVHNISIISEAYRNELRTVRIDQAKVTEIIVDMKSIDPTLVITAPEGTTVLLDDQEFTSLGTEQIITEGEHKLKFSIGNYEIIRSITAIKGKTYSATFSLDLQISEE